MIKTSISQKEISYLPIFLWNVLKGPFSGFKHVSKFCCRIRNLFLGGRSLNHPVLGSKISKIIFKLWNGLESGFLDRYCPATQSFKSISLRPRPPCDGGENECFGFFMHQVIFKGIQGSTLPSGKVRILFLRTYDYIYRNQAISVNLTIGTTASSLKRS